MRGGRAGRCQHDLDIPGRIDPGRTPASLGAGPRSVDRAADAFATIWRDAIHHHGDARLRTDGWNTSGRTGREPAELDLCFRRNRDPVRLAAGDEFMDLAECPRMKRGLAMIDRTEHEIGGALQRRAFRGDPGRYARLAKDATIGLRIFVQAVAAKRQERDPRCDLALAFVQSAQERTTAVELIAEIIVPRKDAVVGYAAQHGMADVRGPAILDVAADRIAAARIANQRDARRPGAASQFLDRFAKLAALIFSGGFVGLRLAIVAAR